MFKYFAFISYSSADYSWGRRLQRKLEHYKMPSTLCSERGWSRHPLKPVFFAPTDIQPGGLSEELKKRLRESRYLIVICSPDSAGSEWVAKEISYFHSLGRSANIHLFIVRGQPGSKDPSQRCFNPVLDELGIPEILGANVHEKVSVWPWVNRERAYVQLITKLLRVEFDHIWQRHRRQMLAQLIAAICGVIMVLCLLLAVRNYSKPFESSLAIVESGPTAVNLPPAKRVIATMYLDNEVKTDTISSFSECAVFRNIPRRYYGRPVRIRAACEDYIPTDTVLVLERDMSVIMARDESFYGSVRFRLFHPFKVMAGCRVWVGGYEALSDEGGVVTLSIPLEDQMPAYPVRAEFPLADTVLIMPNNTSTAIAVRYED